MEEAKKLFSNSSIVFIGTMIASVFSYLFNMLVGRLLGPAKYGEFASVLSIMTILSVGSGAIIIVVMKYSSELFAENKFNALRRLMNFFTRYIAAIGLILFLLGLLFVGPISNYLSIQNHWPVAIALANFIVGFLIYINRGFLQGTQRFVSLSAVNITEMLLRLLIGIFLIWMGFSTSGAMAGVVLATTIAYLVSFLLIVKFFKKHKGHHNENYQFDKRDIVRYSIPSLVTSILLTIGQVLDIILVKHYFDPSTAGKYAAVSTIAKIIFFAMGPIASVMFPMISEKKSKGDKHYKLFLTSLVLTLAGSLVILGIYYIMPGTVIRILYGSDYASYYLLLPQLGFFVLIYSLINLIVNYFMVIRDYIFVGFFVLLLGLQIFLTAANHSSLEVFVKILIFTYGLLFISLFGYYLITKKDQILAYFRGEYGEES